MGRQRAKHRELPPRLYQRLNQQSIAWFYKYPNGQTRVLVSISAASSSAEIQTAQAEAIHKAKILHRKRTAKAPPKMRPIPRSVRPVEKKDLSTAPMWAWNLYRKAKADARRRGIPWQLHAFQYADLVTQSKNVCALSGIPFEIPEGKRRGPFGPSLDRIRSDGPYAISNVRLVCVAVNVALNVWGDEVFLRVALATADRYRAGYIPKFGI